nr:MAG TPA: hypothetical protein [Caudoviricetes sp.]
MEFQREAGAILNGKTQRRQNHGRRTERGDQPRDAVGGIPTGVAPRRITNHATAADGLIQGQAAIHDHIPHAQHIQRNTSSRNGNQILQDPTFRRHAERTRTVSKDNEIVNDIINGLSQRLNMRVYDKYPTVKATSQYPLIIVTRQNASDITPYIRHLDIAITVVTRELPDGTDNTLSAEIGDALTDWYNQSLWDIMGAPLLNTTDAQPTKDGRVSTVYDYQLEYLS